MSNPRRLRVSSWPVGSRCIPDKRWGGLDRVVGVAVSRNTRGLVCVCGGVPLCRRTLGSVTTAALPSPSCPFPPPPSSIVAMLLLLNGGRDRPAEGKGGCDESTTANLAAVYERMWVPRVQPALQHWTVGLSDRGGRQISDHKDIPTIHRRRATSGVDGQPTNNNQPNPSRALPGRVAPNHTDTHAYTRTQAANPSDADAKSSSIVGYCNAIESYRRHRSSSASGQQE
jgi:hypothetical protein